MSYSDVQRKRIMEAAPECDKRCSWCGSQLDWTCVDFNETEHGTTIYEYECTYHNEFNDVCGRPASQEFEDEDPALDY